MRIAACSRPFRNVLRLFTFSCSRLCLVLLGLLDLANAYCETELKARCQQLIRQSVSVENVAVLYSTANKYEAHVRSIPSSLLNWSFAELLFDTDHRLRVCRTWRTIVSASPCIT